MDILLEGLKWAGLILLAGFIGQFGRSLALRTMAARKARQEADQPQEPATPPPSSEVDPPPPEPLPDKEALKREKKRLKALKKQQKKSQ